MRVTNNILSSNLLINLQKSSNKMINLQNTISTGKAISKPSDNPAKIAAIMGLTSSISSMEKWKTNASQAIDYMSSTESVVGNMTSMLQRIRELSLQAANGTNSSENLKVIKKEVDELIRQLEVMANSQVNMKYVFAGTFTNTPPLESAAPPAPPSYTWQGNDESLKVEMGSNINIDISVDGRKLFGVDDPEPLFTSLTNLSQALEDGNINDISNSVGDLDAHLDTFIDARAELGAKISRVERIFDNLDTSIINAKTNLSNMQDTDLAAAIMDYNSTMNTYRAALSVGAQIIQPSLVDFIK